MTGGAIAGLLPYDLQRRKAWQQPLNKEVNDRNHTKNA